MVDPDPPQVELMALHQQPANTTTPVNITESNQQLLRTMVSNRIKDNTMEGHNNPTISTNNSNHK